MAVVPLGHAHRLRQLGERYQIVERVAAGAPRQHGTHVVELRGVEAERTQHGFGHPLLVGHPGGGFERGAEYVVAGARVVVTGADRGDERVVLEQRQHVLHVVEMAGVQHGAALAAPVAQAREVRGEQPRGDRHAGFHRKGRHVALDGGVEIEAATLPQFEHREARNGLRDARDAQDGAGRDPCAVLQVGEPEAPRVHEASAGAHRDLDANILLASLQLEDDLPDACGVARWRGRCLREEQQQQWNRHAIIPFDGRRPDKVGPHLHHAPPVDLHILTVKM